MCFKRTCDRVFVESGRTLIRLTRLSTENVSGGLPSASESARIKRGYMDGVEPTHSDLLLQETGRRRYRAIIESLSAAHPEAVLDLGCGEGNLATMLSGEGLEIKLLLGCDLDRSKLLKAARNQFPDGGAASFVRTRKTCL